MGKLKQVESRHEELLQELQLLNDQKSNLSSQVATNGHLFQETEHEVIYLSGQINNN